MKKRWTRVLSGLLAVVMVFALVDGAMVGTVNAANQIQQDIDISSDGLIYNGHTYQLYDESMTWLEAKAFCEQNGGHLVTITSAEEQQTIEGLLKQGTRYQYWIGLNTKSGQPEWVTGEEYDYSYWAKNEPNATHRNDGEVEYYCQIYNIFAFSRATVGDNYCGWNDMFYDNTSPENRWYFSPEYVGFICEWDSVDYSFDWHDEMTPIASVLSNDKQILRLDSSCITTNNMVLAVTALSSLAMRDYTEEDESGNTLKLYHNYDLSNPENNTTIEKYVENYFKDKDDTIWDAEGGGLGSWQQFYSDIVGNYIIVKHDNHQDDSGFYAVCFKSPDGKYIISYRGTENGSDAWTDFQFAAMNILDNQFNHALDFYREIVMQVSVDCPDDSEEEQKNRIVLVGHSLGGALAAYVSICTGVRAYTVDGADGHILDTTFWESYKTVSNYEGIDKLCFVNFTDRTDLIFGIPALADTISRVHEGKYPMIIYNCQHCGDAIDWKGTPFNNVVFGAHHPLSYLTYDSDLNMFVLSQRDKVIPAYSNIWSHDINNYMYKLLSDSNPLLKPLACKGQVQLGTSQADSIVAPLTFDPTNRYVQFGGYGADSIHGSSFSDLQVAGGTGTVLDGQTGADTYIIDSSCKYATINDPSGDDVIILKGWDSLIYYGETTSSTGESYRCITDGQRVVYVNTARSMFSGKIKVYCVDSFLSKDSNLPEAISDNLFSSEVMYSNIQYDIRANSRKLRQTSLLSVNDSVIENTDTPMRLLYIEGTTNLSIFDSNGNLLEDRTFSNEAGDNTAYSDYAYYYGYNHLGEDPYALVYLFNDGYSVKISNTDTISAALYQYNTDEDEIVQGFFVEEYKPPEDSTIELVSAGSEAGFYLTEQNSERTQIEDKPLLYAQSVALSSKEISLHPDDTVTLTVLANPIDAVTDGTWFSSNEAIASVEGGKITAYEVGSADIYFNSINGKSAVCTVNVLYAEKHTVTVLNGSGSCNCVDGTPVTIIANDPSMGMRFKEWSGTDGLDFTNGNMTTATATFIMPAKAVVLEAVYEYDIASSYNLAYNASGGRGAPAAQTKTQGTALTLSSTVPTRTGYTFLGWADSADATAAQYQPGGRFTTDADTTLYAVWKQDPASITFVTRSGTSVTATITCSAANATAYCAAYTASGQMVALSSRAVTGDGAAHTYTFSLPAGSYAAVKVFLVDSGFQPLCPGMEG